MSIEIERMHKTKHSKSPVKHDGGRVMTWVVCFQTGLERLSERIGIYPSLVQRSDLYLYALPREHLLFSHHPRLLKLTL